MPSSTSLLVTVTRDGVIESGHLGDVVVATPDGTVTTFAGDATRPVYPRSALKPFQTTAVLSTLQDLGLHPQEEHLAIISASHDGGDDQQVEAASVLAEAGLDPTYVIGGQLKSAGANARLGQGTCLVAEADESDASFLHLSPMLAAVTNIDADHLETYGGDFNRLRETFVEFLQRLPFYGLAILCADDAELTRLIPRIGRPITTYGFAADADVRVLSHRAAGNGSDFRARLADGSEADFHLNLPGRHNVQNALVALVIGQELGADVAAMARALKRFEGVGRRCEHHGRLRVGRVEFDLVDDYGHHPRELAATFEAMRSAYPGRRLVVAFQPHRYSRTRDCFDDFSAVLSGVDALVMTEVYAAGETPIEGADARALARSIRAREQVEPVLVDRVSGIEAALLPMLRNDDVVLTLGAGDIGGFAPLLAQQYRIQGVPA